MASFTATYAVGLRLLGSVLMGKIQTCWQWFSFCFETLILVHYLWHHASMSSTGYVISWVQACQIPGSQLHQGNFGLPT